MKAFCWAEGNIEFGRSTPEGALEIASAPATRLRKTITTTARHSYDGKILFVPGVPEAESGREAVDAVITYCNWLKPMFTEAR